MPRKVTGSMRILHPPTSTSTAAHWAWLLLLGCLFLKSNGAALNSSGCAQGDAACFCKLVSGKWLTTPSVLLPTCRKTVPYKGTSRVVDIYFPRNIRSDTNTRFNAWIHLHGVHKAAWVVSDYPQWQQLQKAWELPLAGNVEAARLGVLAGPRLDAAGGASARKGAGLLQEDDTILVVPNAPGTAEAGQIWNSGFWPCMQALGRCADKDVDDTGFIASLISTMQSALLPGILLQPRVQASGYSNGGMLLQALLCKQPEIAKKLSGVAIVASALGSEFAGNECGRKLPVALPVLWVHGTNDTTLPYGAGTTEGVAVMGAEAALKLWAANLESCPVASARSSTVFQSAEATCWSYCQLPGGGGRPAAVLCALPGRGHLVWTEPPPGSTAGLVHWGLNGFQGKPAAGAAPG